MNILLTFFATIILALAVCVHVNGDTNQQNITDILSGDSEGAFARAIEPIEFVFPKDHGPHPDYKTEWWYYTGNLKTDSGREFGYQLTFFPKGVDCGDACTEIASGDKSDLHGAFRPN